ncbi:hypothetical protein [Stenotrophomonas maltophilia]|uniref:hypothetical protein n=1 Tax=Stenotrophomonas maltophilia TaxID=40324 RepID=UPI000D0E05EC|nr:hypothetical protein [Stenotrophomonas maltophilia]PSM13594.1 hypothetical protein CV100_11250 [Stenotrophomonas maltophilia]
MAGDKSFSRAILEGVVVAAIVGAGTWALKFMPVIGQWLSKGVTVPVWAILGIALALPLLFVLALSSSRASKMEVAAIQQVSPQAPSPWRPEGLTFLVLRALRAVDAGALNPEQARKFLRVAGFGIHPLSDVTLALEELEEEGYAHLNYSAQSGMVYKLVGDGIRFAQREDIPTMPYAELRRVWAEMDRLRD